MSTVKKPKAVAQSVPQSPDLAALQATWTEANGHAASGRFDEALPRYQWLAQWLPEVADIWCNMGAALDVLGRRAEAIEALRRAVAVDPLSVLAQRSLASLLEGVGDFQGAVAHYREAVSIDPGQLESMRGLGCALHLAGQLREAHEVLRQALTLGPEDVQSHFYLGNVLAALKELVPARHHLKIAYRLSGDARAGCNLANLLLETRQYADAEALLREIVDRNPEHAPSWNGLGGALLKVGRLPEARAALEQALAVDPTLTAAMHGLARCLFKMGDLEGALDRFEAVAVLRPEAIEARVDASRALQHLGRFAEAESWQRAILKVTDDDAQAWCDLAITLQRLDRYDEAQDAVDRALAIEPRFSTALLLAADLSAIAGDLRGGISLAQEALEHAHGDIKLMNAVGGLFEQWHNEDLAIATYRMAVKASPDNAFAAARLFDLSLSVCDWRDYAQNCRAQIASVEAAVQAGAGSRGIDVFNLQALPVDYSFVARAASHAAAAIAREAREHAPATEFQHRPRRRERIRLGYAMAYTYFHSLPMVLKEVIERHDRDRFELFGYSLGKCDNLEFSRGFRAAFDHFSDVPRSAPYGAAERIHRDDIDVLIDVSGLTGQTCMPIMSFRPAPVQMHAFGYSITTGADYIDYLITDRTYIPPEWAALGSEKLIYMPDTFMPTSRPPVLESHASRAENGLPEDAIVFCNFNHPCKFEPRIFDAWMAILAAVPDSVLWFGSWMHNTQRNLRREAEARGIDGERLIFAQIVEHHEHLARLPLADIALDNYYHGGGVTTLDVLWAGVPLLSAPGIAPGGRLGATLSRAIGMPELVCVDLESYVARAIALAQDSAARRALRGKLLEQRTVAPLFDTDLFTRNLERGIAAAWDNHLAGQPPRMIDLAASIPAHA